MGIKERTRFPCSYYINSLTAMQSSWDGLDLEAFGRFHGLGFRASGLGLRALGFQV